MEVPVFGPRQSSLQVYGDTVQNKQNYAVPLCRLQPGGSWNTDRNRYTYLTTRYRERRGRSFNQV